MSVTIIEERGLGAARRPSFHESCLVVVPALNDQETVADVVLELRAQGFEHIRVVDSGSIDATQERARTAGAEVLELTRCGFGQACRHGLENLPQDIGWILFCTADGGYDLGDIDLLIAAAKDADLVIGSRTKLRHKAMTLAQHFGNQLVGKLIEHGWGFRFTDFGSLRLIRREALEAIEMRNQGIGWNVVMQIRALEARLLIREVPVRSRVRHSASWTFHESIAGLACAGFGIFQAVARFLFRGWQTKPSR